MKLVSLIHLLYLFCYFILAGQAVFYKLCFANVFTRITAKEFVGIRRLADPILQTRLSIVYYSSLGLGIAFIIAMGIQGTEAGAMIAGVVLIMLMADIIMAKKYSIPLNTKIREIHDTSDAVARRLQTEWIKWIGIRGHFILIGFFFLLLLAFL